MDFNDFDGLKVDMKNLIGNYVHFMYILKPNTLFKCHHFDEICYFWTEISPSKCLHVLKGKFVTKLFYANSIYYHGIFVARQHALNGTLYVELKTKSKKEDLYLVVIDTVGSLRVFTWNPGCDESNLLAACYRVPDHGQLCSFVHHD